MQTKAQPLALALFDAKLTLIQAARGFYQNGWMAGTAGNLSLRLSEPSQPLEYLITASGRDKGALTLSDFVRVDAQGQSLEPENPHKSSAETLLHGTIYQQFPNVGAVYHVHTVEAGLVSTYGTTPQGTLFFEGLEMLKGLGFSTHETEVSLPVLDNSQDMQALSQHLPEKLQPNVPGFLLKGHGLYTWGSTPSEAKRHVEIWDYLFRFKLAELRLKQGF